MSSCNLKLRSPTRNPRSKLSRSCWKKMGSGSPPDISSSDLTKQNHQKINENQPAQIQCRRIPMCGGSRCQLRFWLWQESRCWRGEGCNFGGPNVAGGDRPWRLRPKLAECICLFPERSHRRKMENVYGNGPQTAGRFGVAQIKSSESNSRVARRTCRPICRDAIRDFIHQ